MRNYFKVARRGQHVAFFFFDSHVPADVERAWIEAQAYAGELRRRTYRRTARAHDVMVSAWASSGIVCHRIGLSPGALAA